MPLKIVVLFLLAICSSFAADAIHSIKFKNDKLVTFTEQQEFTIYPLSERAMPAIQASLQREVVAADYLTGIKIKTNDPRNAAQTILGQISENIGQKLAPFWNSRLEITKPAAILTGAGKYSTWTIFITPAEGGDYWVTVSYVIEKSKDL